MPVITGAEFFGKVKTLYPDTVRILFSGYIEIEALTDAVNRGAVYRFLLKPWDDEALRESIRQAFHHYWLTHKDLERRSRRATPSRRCLRVRRGERLLDRQPDAKDRAFADDAAHGDLAAVSLTMP